jgi:hypothetical protein
MRNVPSSCTRACCLRRLIPVRRDRNLTLEMERRTTHTRTTVMTADRPEQCLLDSVQNVTVMRTPELVGPEFELDRLEDRDCED